MTVSGWLTPRRDDAVLCAVMLAVSQVEVWVYDVAGGSWAAAGTLGLAAAALLYRQRYPVMTLVLVATGLTLCAQLAGQPFSVTSVVTFVTAMFSVGAMTRRRTSLVVLVVALVLSVFTVQPLTLNNYLGISLSSIGVPWLLGALWLRRSSAREEEQRQQDAAERAGAADITLGKDPTATRESLHAIETGARNTLLELRRLLGLLREEDPDPGTSRAAISDLPMLFVPLEQAGVAVTLDSTGLPDELSRDLEMTAFRVVQEALTNVVKHAGPCRVTVSLRCTTDTLCIQVADDGRAPAAADSRGGYGLSGIRERVAALGGSVNAGPHSGGGFVVEAQLPLGTP
jgi:signal transduction histidine kinase